MVKILDVNTEVRKNPKNDLEKHFFKFMNHVVFGKIIRNVSKYRSIMLVTTEARRNCLVLELNYHATKKFSDNLLAIETKIILTLMNKTVYLVPPVSEISKVVMYE